MDGSAQPLGGGPSSAQVCLPVVGWSPTTSTLPSGFLSGGRKEAVKFFVFFSKTGQGRGWEEEEDDYMHFLYLLPCP